MRPLFSFCASLALAALAGCGSAGGAAPAAPDPLALPHESTELILMLADPDDEEEAEDLRDEFGGLQLERIGTSAFYVLRVPDGTDLMRLLDDLGGDLRVVDSQPNYLVPSPRGGPSDVPVFGDDLLASIPGQGAFALLDLPGAQAISTGTGQVVAVVDTGVDPTHPLLVGRLAPGGFDFIGRDADPTDERNFLDDDGDGLVDEQYGHGTFVASLILAVAPDVLLLPVRALNDEGVGTAASVAAAILWAVDSGALVINVSVDVPASPDVLRRAIDYAEDRGVVIIGAAGNAGANEVVFPARYGAVVAVAAVSGSGILAPYSNRGSAVDLAAPGTDLVGAMPLALAPNGTARWSGTSFSAPLVAGAAALVRSAFPALNREEVLDRLQARALPLDSLNPAFRGRLGAGLIAPARALLP
ncbi:MAG: S8 family serine peptidase [Planctomycetaceae bacterium]